MRVVKVCVICGKAFTDDGHSVCCGSKCSQQYNRLNPTERAELKELAKLKQKEPRIDCKMYVPQTHSCSGLNALWCMYENCKFHKPKGKGNNATD